MPEFALSPGVSMFYQDDDFTDPWRPAQAVLMLHGNAESGVAWNGWMPAFGRRFRVVRPDMRGFGRSTPMPVEYPWSLEGILDDFMRLCDHIKLGRFHLIAAKVAGPMAIRLAATRPERVLTMTVIGAPVSIKTLSAGRGAGGTSFDEATASINAQGMEAWARASMGHRLGSDCPPEFVEGWIKLMGATALSTEQGFRRGGQGIDVVPDLPSVKCPTLVVTTEGSRVGSTVADMRAWQERIPRSELLVLPSDSYHVSVTHPELCARATLDFIDRAAVTA